MTKEEQIEQLVEYIIEAMDMSALENYAKQQLEEYYNSPEGVEDFNTNYAEMKEIMGDEQMDLIDEELKKELDKELKDMQDLVEWELSTMDYTSLQDYFYEAKMEFYTDHPDSYKDMQQYMKECTDPSVDFYWDVEKNVGQKRMCSMWQ